jgi:hypothetical protein
MLLNLVFPNELCPCGSGKKYKNCCANNNSLLKNENGKPLAVEINERFRKSLVKCCMHPDKENCKGKVKKAHALQNSKIISLLAGSHHHVYLMDNKSNTEVVQLDKKTVIPFSRITKVGANQATTETCFCDFHDSIVFSAIEKNSPDFIDESEEMKFIYAYKTFIFEYYKHFVTMNALTTLFKESPKTFILAGIMPHFRDMSLKSKEFNEIKSYYDERILNKTFDGLRTVSIRIPYGIKFAVYSYISPPCDMNGKKIKTIVKNKMHRLAITVFPETNQSWILVSCLESEAGIFKTLFTQFEQSSIDKIKTYFNWVLPAYSENIILSPDLWDNWNEDTKVMFECFLNSDVTPRSIQTHLRKMFVSNDENKYVEQPIYDLFAR